MCICGVAGEKRFDCVERAVIVSPEMDELLAGCEVLASDSSKWMSVLRCRSCGTVWVEAWTTTGQMDLKHLYPAPEAGEDPARWIQEKGKALPMASWLV